MSKQILLSAMWSELVGDRALYAPSRRQPQTNLPYSLGPGSKSLTLLMMPVAEG